VGFHVWLWASLEIHVGIICASFPAIKPLIVRIIPSLALLGSGDGPLDLENKGTRQVFPIAPNGKRVKMRLSAMVNEGSVESGPQNFWTREIATASAERVVYKQKRRDSILNRERGRGVGFVESQDMMLRTVTEVSNNVEVESALRDRIRKTVEFHLREEA
jgi:hypothetical protein